MADKEKKKGGIRKWLREFKSEFKKVVWPSGKQLKNNTIVVIVTVLVITAIIFAFDSGFKALVGLVVPDYNSSVITDTVTDDGLESDNGDTDENNDGADAGDTNGGNDGETDTGVSSDNNSSSAQ